MGMIYVTCGGKFKHGDPSEVHGGSNWGSGNKSKQTYFYLFYFKLFF